MKKRSVIAGAQRLFVILAFISLSQVAKAQCTPGFLGNDRPLVLCSASATIDYSNLFQVPASYSATPILPATDTIRRPGLPDTIIFHQVKLRVIATLTNGCKDTAIVRIPFNIDPFPNLGPDSTLLICPGATKDISGFYNTGRFQATWSPGYPFEAGEGVHVLTVVTRDGCRDTATVTLLATGKPDLGPDINSGVQGSQRVNLNTLIPAPPFPIAWSTSNPTSAPAGTYEGIATNPDGCSDTVLVTLCQKPDLGPDKTLQVCPGETLNLFETVTIPGVTMSWNTASPFAVGTGSYRGIAENSCGQRDTFFVNVTPANKPNLGSDREEEICSGEFLNISNFFNLAGLNATWSLPDPASAPVGRHSIIGANAAGCKDTAVILIKGLERPSFFNDTLLFVCQNQTKDLTKLFTFDDNEWFLDFGGLAQPTAAGEGIYTVSAENSTCRFQAKVELRNFRNQVTGNLPLCIFQKSQFGVFTSNNFRSVTVDKDGITWAGIDDGGLYQFVPSGDNCGGTWQKSALFVNATHKDLHVSPIENDFDVWSASSGHQGAFATTGGAYRITSLDNIKRFGSSFDNNQFLGPLSSRFANSLAISPSGRLYVALSTSLDIDNSIKPGGVYEYNLLGDRNTTTFTQVAVNLPNNEDVNVYAAGMRGDEAWFSVGRSCDQGNCSNPYIVKWNTVTNSAAGFVNQTNSPLPFNQQQAIVRSIFTDSQERTWLGFNSGLGMGLLAPPFEGAEPEWFHLTSINSGLPNNTSINFNAITEINGEIWIGTNKGLLVYDGISDFTDCRSYKLYTTANGLPSNNVTDVAYDTVRLEVWLTTDNGICRLKQPASIVGNVVDIFGGKYPDLLSTLGRLPLADVEVKLLSNSGQTITTVTTDASGNFELTAPKPQDKYRVEFRYAGKFHYRLNDVAGNAVVGEVMIPDSLIKEIHHLSDLLKEESTAFKLIGFDIFNFDFDAFNIDSVLVRTNRFEQLIIGNPNDSARKLANYYLVLACIEKGSLTVGKLDTEIAVSMLDALESLLSATTVGKTMVDKMKGKTSAKLDAAVKWAIKLFESKTEIFLGAIRTLQARALAEGDQKKASALKKIESVLGAVLKAVVKIKEGGLKDGGKVSVQNTFYDTIKRGLATLMTKFIFELTYVADVQPTLNRASGSFLSAVEDKGFDDVYKLLIFDENSDTAIAVSANRILEERLRGMANLKTVAKVADVVGKLAEAASKVAAVTLPQAAPVLKALEVVCKVAQPIVYVGSGFYGYLGADQITEMVKTSNPKAGFPTPAGKQSVPIIVQSSDPRVFALQKKMELYHQSLDQFRQLLVQNDSVAAYVQLSKVADYSTSSGKALSELIDDALGRISRSNNQIPVLGDYAVTMIDTGYTRLLSNEFAFSLVAERYLDDSAKVGFVPDFDSVITNIKQLNSLTLRYLSGVKGMTEQLQVAGFASIRVSDIIYPEVIGYESMGQVRVVLRNNGTLNINNLKLHLPSVPFFQSMSYDSTQTLATLLPGKSAGFVFTVRSTTVVDTTVRFQIFYTGSGGITDSLTGYISSANLAIDTSTASIRAGNWSDPTMWNNGQLPTSSSNVVIRHNIVIDVDADVRSIRVESPAQVQVAPGRRVRLVQQRP